jgi:hypothetical protein
VSGHQKFFGISSTDGWCARIYVERMQELTDQRPDRYRNTLKLSGLKGGNSCK